MTVPRPGSGGHRARHQDEHSGQGESSTIRPGAQGHLRPSRSTSQGSVAMLSKASGGPAQVKPSRSMDPLCDLRPSPGVCAQEGICWHEHTEPKSGHHSEGSQRTSGAHGGCQTAAEEKLKAVIKEHDKHSHKTTVNTITKPSMTKGYAEESSNASWSQCTAQDLDHLTEQEKAELMSTILSRKSATSAHMENVEEAA